MASIITESNGRRMIQFVGKDRRRRSLRLGKVTLRIAEAVKVRVEALNSAAIAGHPPDPETLRWVASLDVRLVRKLVKTGLVADREAAMLGPFLASYISDRADVKPRTTIGFKQVEKALLAYFGANKRLDAISPGDADAFRLHLLKTLGDNTARRRCGRAKQFFRAAVRKRLISENPFGDLKNLGVRANKGRDHFVPRDVAAKVLEACPDAQWRLIFALSRYAGLRCPSEHLELRWTDMDWAGNRMTVRSPKTEHNEGGESRIVPMFPELRPYLDAAYDQAEEGAEFVITRYRDANANLRTQLLRILARAGVKPWQKLFQNLRSTRETELAAEHPLHVVCEWIGNSPKVALKHYLRATEGDFTKAAGEGGAKSEARDSAAVRKSNLQPAAKTDSHLQKEKPQTELCSSSSAFAVSKQLLQNYELAEAGLEPALP